MKSIRNLFLIGAAFSFALAACGGGGTSSNVPGSATIQHAPATFIITIPHAVQSTALKPKYISPATASVTIALAAGALTLPTGSPCAVAGGVVTCATTSASPGCNVTAADTTCTLNVIAPVGADQFILNMLDLLGNKLSIGQIAANVASAGATIALTMNGVVAHVTLALGTPVITGSSTKVPVIVTATDASGATIIGPGSFSAPIALTNSDTTGHTVLSPTSVADPATGQTGVFLTYDGSPAVTSATISAPGTSATPVIFTPTPAATPTPTPSPAATPTIAPQSCNAQVTAGTYTAFVTSGNFASMGAGAYTLDPALNASGYVREVVTPVTPSPTPSATPTPVTTPTPTPTPVSTPTATPTPNPVYLYFGTYSVAALPGGNATSGCALFEATQNGTPLLTGSADNGLGIGLIQPAPGFAVSGSAGSGAFTAMVLNVSANGTGSGTFTLDDGEAGSITITSRLAFAKFRKPQFLMRP